jgi:hypothetical protein
MASFSSLDDMRSLQTKIDQKAQNLFKERTGQAPLIVTRIFKHSAVESEENTAKLFEKGKEVLNITDVKRLRYVRTFQNLVPVLQFRYM